MFSIATMARDTGSRTFIADNPQQVLFGLTFGHEVLVTRGRIRRRAAAVRQLIESGKAGAYFGAPYVWMEMIEQAGNRSRLPSSLRGVPRGAPVTPEFPRTAIVAPPRHGHRHLWNDEPAGRARPPTEDRLVGGRLPLVMGTDVSVEIRDHRPGLFSGYIGQPDRADEGFPTGDLGRIIDQNGEADRPLGRSATRAGSTSTRRRWRTGFGRSPTMRGGASCARPP
jgi:hypothetical protein